jgi:hypothetical protein
MIKIDPTKDCAMTTTTTTSSKHVLSVGLAAVTLIAVLPFFGTDNKESSGEVR